MNVLQEFDRLNEKMKIETNRSEYYDSAREMNFFCIDHVPAIVKALRVAIGCLNYWKDSGDPDFEDTLAEIKSLVGDV